MADGRLIARIESLKKAVSEIRGKPFLEELTVHVKTRKEIHELLLKKHSGRKFMRDVEKTRKVLLKLGLVNPELDLAKSVVDMFTEQFGGFYDPETKKLYVISESAGDDFSGHVAAHEIFHALQEQYFQIETMVNARRHDDDRALAARGVIEGEATLGGLEYLAREKGLSVLESTEDIGKECRRKFEKDLEDKPDCALARVPAFIREMVLFRYCEGTSFVQRVLKQKGSWKKLDCLFNRCPLSTEQVMHPEKYLDKVDYPVRIILPKLHKKLSGGWNPVMTGTMGEFNIKTILSDYVGKERARNASAGWDGDSYTLIESGGETTLRIFAWLSVWDSPEDAGEFVKAWLDVLAGRFKKKPEITGSAYFIKSESDETAVIEPQGTQVLVIQGAPLALIPGIRSALLEARRVAACERDFNEFAGRGQAPEKTVPAGHGAEENDR